MSIAALHEACQKADFPTVQKILSQSPDLLDTPDQRYGWTPLHRSLICGHSSIAKLLLKQGADPNMKTAVGEPPLYLAVDLNQPSLVQLLLNYGAEPNCRNADGETPLHLATFKGSKDVMETLLIHGADPDLKDSVFDRTPIHIATERGDEECIQLLLRYNAAPPLPCKVPAMQSLGKTLRRDNTLSKSASPGTMRREMNQSREGRIERKSSDSLAQDRDNRRTVYQGINEIDQLTQKIRSAVKEEPRSPNSVTITEATVAEPDSEKLSTIRSQPAQATLETEVRNGLLEWLRDIKLDELHARLLESGFDDIEEMISQQSSDMPLTPQILKDIGIEKPGHRYILLAALELEGAAATQAARKPHHSHTYSCMNPYTSPSALLFFPSLDKWLSSLHLETYTAAFQTAGFQYLDQLLALMHTSYKLDERVLESEVGIKKLGHRHRILSSLHETAKESDPRRLMFISGGHHFRVPVRRSAKTDVNQSCQVM